MIPGFKGKTAMSMPGIIALSFPENTREATMRPIAAVRKAIGGEQSISEIPERKEDAEREDKRPLHCSEALEPLRFLHRYVVDLRSGSVIVPVCTRLSCRTS